MPEIIDLTTQPEDQPRARHLELLPSPVAHENGQAYEVLEDLHRDPRVEIVDEDAPKAEPATRGPSSPLAHCAYDREVERAPALGCRLPRPEPDANDQSESAEPARNGSTDSVAGFTSQRRSEEACDGGDDHVHAVPGTRDGVTDVVFVRAQPGSARSSSPVPSSRRPSFRQPGSYAALRRHDRRLGAGAAAASPNTSPVMRSTTPSGTYSWPPHASSIQ